MKIEVNAVGEGAQEFLDEVRATLAEGYSVTTLSEQRAGHMVTMEAEIEPIVAVEPTIRGVSISGPDSRARTEAIREHFARHCGQVDRYL